MTSVETVPTTTERPYPTYPTLSTASAATLLNELVIFQADPAKTSTETDENPFSVIAADILPLSVNWETATKKLTILLSRAQSTEKQCLLESIFERVAFFPSIYSQDQLQARKAFDAVLMQHTTIDILPTDQVIDWQYAIVRLHERVSNINPEYKEQLLISLLDQSRSLDQQLRLRRINIPITAHEQISAWKQEYAQRVADKNAFDRVLSAFIAEKLLPLNKNVNWMISLRSIPF
jgi:hypothetical protein